jgi:hypothetical protein
MKSISIAIIIFLIVFSGIELAKITGYWRTESLKIPIKIKTGEFAGEYNPEDIRGSYRFSDIAKYFEIPLEDLQKAFGLPADEDVANFQCKELKEIYGYLEEEGKEIGTGSVRLFVALYKGLPYDLSEDTCLPLPAVEILKERANLSDEQIKYLETHSIDISEDSTTKTELEKEEATVEKEDSDV